MFNHGDAPRLSPGACTVSSPPPRDQWEPLPGTDAGGYFRLRADIIAAIPRPGFIQSEAGARESLRALDRIARDAGRKQAVIVLVDRVASQDSAARKVWSVPRADETRCAQALVCSTMLARAIGSFFLGLSKAAIPTRMFADVESAYVWAVRMTVEHGGEL
jgi:hypothetical protein